MMRFLKGMFLENLPTKVMALLLALFLWAYLVYSSLDERTVEVPFRIDIPDGVLVQRVALEDGSIVTDRIAVDITGAKRVLNGVNFKEIRCEHKISADISSPETIGVTVTTEDFNFPEGVVIKPVKMKIALVPMIVMEAKVAVSTADVVGAPADGYLLKDLRSMSPTVRLKIPANLRDGIGEVGIERINIEGKKDHFIAQAAIDVSRFPGVVAMEPIEIEVVIVPIPEKRTVKLPLHFIAPIDFPFEIDVTPKEVTLLLEGPRRAMEEIASDPNGVEAFFRIDRPAAELTVGQKFNLPIEYRFSRKGYDSVIAVTVMPGESNKEAQVEIGNRKKENK